MQKKKMKLFLKSLKLDQKFSFWRSSSLNSILNSLKSHKNGLKAQNHLLKWAKQNISQDQSFDNISIIMAALNFPNNKPRVLPDYAYGEIAPFARAHFYKEMMDRLKSVSSEIRSQSELTKADLVLFCNSSFPEKPMAWAAGLGFIGRNSLLIHPQGGSSFILGGMIIKKPLNGIDIDPALPQAGQCGQCQLCVQACPTGAIKLEGGINLQRCLQHQATSYSIWPDSIKEKWHRRFYGCEICQQICPYYKTSTGEISSYPGYLGAYIKLKDILTMDARELKAFLKQSALGRNWIPPEALIRNAIIALKGQDFTSFKDLIKQLSLSQDPVIADAASWLLKQKNP